MKKTIKRWYRFLHPGFQSLMSEYPIDLKPRYTDKAHEGLEKIISANESEYRAWIDRIINLKSHFRKWDNRNETKSPKWNNGFFPALDMMAYYTIIAYHQPKKIIEVGSGNSTVIASAALKDYQLNTSIISIDPQPRTDIGALVDTLIKLPLEQVESDIFSQLDVGDILFVDNSHRIFPNSDAMVTFLELLPQLKAGVLVHIHDVYLPYDYPQFMCDRFYNEQYGLALLLLANPQRYYTILPNFYIHKSAHLSHLLEPLWSLPKLQNGEKHGGSYWLEIR